MDLATHANSVANTRILPPNLIVLLTYHYDVLVRYGKPADPLFKFRVVTVTNNHFLHQNRFLVRQPGDTPLNYKDWLNVLTLKDNLNNNGHMEYTRKRENVFVNSDARL